MDINISERVAVYGERRREPRYKMKCDCEIIIRDKVYNAEINDISFGGTAIILRDYDNTAEVGDGLTFTFRKSNYPVVEMGAIIRNISQASGYTRFGMEIVAGNKQVWDAIVRTLGV